MSTYTKLDILFAIRCHFGVSLINLQGQNVERGRRVIRGFAIHFMSLYTKMRSDEIESLFKISTTTRRTDNTIFLKARRNNTPKYQNDEKELLKLIKL